MTEVLICDDCTWKYCEVHDTFCFLIRCDQCLDKISTATEE